MLAELGVQYPAAFCGQLQHGQLRGHQRRHLRGLGQRSRVHAEVDQI